MNQLENVLTKKEQRIYNFYQTLDHFLGRKKSFVLFNKKRRAFYKNLNNRFENLPKGELKQVPRISNFNKKDFFENYVKKGIPVVIEGVAKDWECTKKWSIDYFKNRYGNDEIIYIDQHKMDLSYKTLTLKEVLDDIQNGKKSYYRFYPLLEKHPEHLLDFDLKWLRMLNAGHSLAESFQVFMGSDASYTPLHNASLSNLFIQVCGQKHWRFYPNSAIAIIDPDPVRNIYRHAPIRKNNESFNAFEPDFSNPFNLYEKLNGYETILNPGDVLYNPPYFWHTVKNIGNSIGVGYRWLPLKQNFKNYPLYTLLDITSKKPNFFKTIRLLKKDVNLLHLAEKGALKDYLKDKKL